MASAPSASALSAVLRCRGNLWTRNPPTKRPPSAAYGLGLAGGTLRDSPAERGGSSRGPERRLVPRGERLESAEILSVSCRWDTEASGEEEKGFWENDKLSKLSQISQCGAPSGRSAPLRLQLRPVYRSGAPSGSSAPLQLQLNSSFSRIIQIILPAASEANRISLQGINRPPAGVLKLSITTSPLLKVRNPGSGLASLLSWFILSKRLKHQETQSLSSSSDPTQEDTKIHETGSSSEPETTLNPPD